MWKRNKPQRKERTKKQDMAFNELTEAVTPNVYLGDTPLNPDLIDELQDEVAITPVFEELKGQLEKIVRAKHSHLQTRRNFVEVARATTDDIGELSEPRNDWYCHLRDIPGWERWYQVDFSKPYPMTSHQSERLVRLKQKSLILGWKPNTEGLKVPVVVVYWSRNTSKEPSISSGWYFLNIEDGHSGEEDVVNLMYQAK